MLSKLYSIFFEFQKFEMKKMIGNEHEKEGLYYLDLVSKPVMYSNSILLIDHYGRLGHSSLLVLKFLDPKSSQTESLKCESC